MADNFLNKNGLARLWSKIKALFSDVNTDIATVRTWSEQTAADLEALIARVDMLQYQYHTKITANPFLITFDTLDNVTATGIWNSTKERIEC